MATEAGQVNCFGLNNGHSKRDELYHEVFIYEKIEPSVDGVSCIQSLEKEHYSSVPHYKFRSVPPFISSTRRYNVA